MVFLNSHKKTKSLLDRKFLARARPPPANIPPFEIKALNNLHKDKSRLIITADKGNYPVVMDRADYNNKVQNLVKDSKTYKVLKRDPTKKTERELNYMLLDLHREEILNWKN